MRRLHLGHVFGASVFLAAPIAIFASKAMAPLFVATTVLGVAVYWLKNRAWPDLPQFFPAFFVALTLWGLVSAIWSIAPLESLNLVAPLAATFLCGLVLMFLAGQIDEADQRFFNSAMIAGTCFGFVILAIEILSSIAITRALWRIVRGIEIAKVSPDYIYIYENYYKTGLVFASFMIWPSMMALWQRGAKKFVCLLFILALAVIAKGGSGSAALAFMAGWMAFAIAFFLRAWASRLFMAIIIAGVAFLPLAISVTPDISHFNPAGKELPASFYPRIFIWKSAVNFISETPFLGKGLNASRALSTKEDKIQYYTYNKQYLLWSEPIPLHPHNIILQAWLELGVAGAVMLAVLLCALIRRIENNQDQLSRALLYGAFFSILACANVSFGVWQSWWQGALWLMAAYIAAAAGAGNAKRQT